MFSRHSVTYDLYTIIYLPVYAKDTGPWVITGKTGSQSSKHNGKFIIGEDVENVLDQFKLTIFLRTNTPFQTTVTICIFTSCTRM